MKAPIPVLALLIISAGVLTACETLTTEPERNPDDVPIDEILRIMRPGPDSLTADGRTRDTVEVWLPAQAAERSVSLLSTWGSFYGTASAKSLTVRAESAPDGFVARAVLMSDTTKAPFAVITATVRGFSRSLEVPIDTIP